MTGAKPNPARPIPPSDAARPENTPAGSAAPHEILRHLGASLTGPGSEKASNTANQSGSKKPGASPKGDGPEESCGDFGIRIARDGTWFYLGSPIGRKPLVKLFSTVLRREDDGSYWLVTPVERGLIEVEDAPFTAVELQVEAPAGIRPYASAPISTIGSRPGRIIRSGWILIRRRASRTPIYW